MEFNSIKRVYFIGIGGIGMSGLARYFHQMGCLVCGYDRTETELTHSLLAEGINIIFTDDENLVPISFQEPSEDTLVIYTPAIPTDSSILNYFKAQGFELKKRAEVLGIISKGMFCVAIAGTHGKTTTSSMVAHILTASGKECSAFLGGVASNYNSNVLFGTSNILVVEADEYDRSFLTLHPNIAVITSMDVDHLDIYGDSEHLTESFQLFASQVDPQGKLITKSGLAVVGNYTYSTSQSAQIEAQNVRISQGQFVFDFVSPELNIPNITLGLPGLHNVENALAAIQVALLLSCTPEQIKVALASFKGVKRRFEQVVKTDKHVYIDDYAHHPEELKACITAVKSLYPDKKLTTIFQPHLFSRTRDFTDGFAQALSMSDALWMLDIYPARELPIEGVNAELILRKTTLTDRHIFTKNEVLAQVRATMPELILTVGAGDIDTLVEPLKNILSHD
jgi:UDP-N-acetylmuramate--alanine ligase